MSVKKKALQCVGELLAVSVNQQQNMELFMFFTNEAHRAISVRAGTMNCLSCTFFEVSIIFSDHQAKPECNMVQRVWLQGVVPAVVDSENSVQEKALEALDQVVLSQVKQYSASRHLDASQRLTWDLLGLLCHECQNLRLDQIYSFPLLSI